MSKEDERRIQKKDDDKHRKDGLSVLNQDEQQSDDQKWQDKQESLRNTSRVKGEMDECKLRERFKETTQKPSPLKGVRKKDLESMSSRNISKVKVGNF